MTFSNRATTHSGPPARELDAARAWRRMPRQAAGVAAFATGSVCLLAFAAPQRDAVGASANEWWLYSEIRILPESIAPGVWYRLANQRGGGTITPRRGSGPLGLGWGRSNAQTGQSSGRPNVRLHRLVQDPDAGEYVNVGHFVRLNEPVAIEVRGKGFLVHRAGSSGSALRWESNPRYSVHSHPGVYQWRFEVTGNVRDHRQRTIRTKEQLALFNTARSAYLVYRASEGNTLKWDR